MLRYFVDVIIHYAYIEKLPNTIELPVPTTILEEIKRFISEPDTKRRYTNPKTIQIKKDDLDLGYALEVAIRYNKTLFVHITQLMEEQWSLQTKDIFVHEAMAQFKTAEHEYHDDVCTFYNAAQERGKRHIYCEHCNTRCPT